MASKDDQAAKPAASAPQASTADAWAPETQLVHGGVLRSQFGETSEALFLTQGFVYTCAEQAEARTQGRYLGIGLGCVVEKAGLGPADGVRIQVDTSGAVEVITGGASIGQGFETVMAQICAETLGVDYRRIRVVHGRTDRIDHGIGVELDRPPHHSLESLPLIG